MALEASFIGYQAIEGEAWQENGVEEENRGRPGEQPLKGWSHELKESDTVPLRAECAWGRFPRHASRKKLDFEDELNI
jgi:hypothetical protein